MMLLSFSSFHEDVIGQRLSWRLCRHHRRRRGGGGGRRRRHPCRHRHRRRRRLELQLPDLL